MFSQALINLSCGRSVCYNRELRQGNLCRGGDGPAGGKVFGHHGAEPGEINSESALTPKLSHNGQSLVKE